MNNTSSKVAFIFQPWLVLIVSLAGATTFGIYMLRSPSTRAHMFEPSSSFMYVVPIVVPFVAFLLDRVEQWHERHKLQLLVDALVVATAMWRVVGDVPFVSGHTLFLSYSILSSRSVVARVTAILVMAQAVYLKYFVWHDFVTSTCGILLGCAAAFVALRMANGRTRFLTT